MFNSTINNNQDHIYYNIDIINANNKATIEEDPNASFTETRDSPILSDISKYKMSIVRFTMNGIRNLPLFIPIIENDQANRNKTIYKLSIKYNNIEYTENIIYEPENTKYPTPTILKQEFSNPYYYIHSYQHFINLVNKTLKDLIDQINIAETVSLKKPFFIFDSNNKKFNLYLPKNETYELFFNDSINNLLSFFPHKYTGRTDDLTYRIYNPYPDGINEKEISTTPYKILTQEYVSLGSYFSPIESLVFTSNLLPIAPEGVAPPSIYSKSNINKSVNSSSHFENILTDISLTLDDAYEYKNFISYIPSTYRYTSLGKSHQNIKSINIRIFWKCRYNGALIPLRMSNLSNIGIKILFEKLH